MAGTKIEAQANKHRVVWAKRNRQYQEQIRNKVQEILVEVEWVNAAVDELYGEGDLPEVDLGQRIDSATLQKTIDEIN